MSNNVNFAVIAVIGIIVVAVVAIVVLSRFASKHPKGKVEVSLSIPGCKFGAKASSGDTDDNSIKPELSQTPKESHPLAD